MKSILLLLLVSLVVAGCGRLDCFNYHRDRCDSLLNELHMLMDSDTTINARVHDRTALKILELRIATNQEMIEMNNYFDWDKPYSCK